MEIIDGSVPGSYDPSILVEPLNMALILEEGSLRDKNWNYFARAHVQFWSCYGDLPETAQLSDILHVQIRGV